MNIEDEYAPKAAQRRLEEAERQRAEQARARIEAERRHAQRLLQQQAPLAGVDTLEAAGEALARALGAKVTKRKGKGAPRAD
jgi:hypothetical protein